MDDVGRYLEERWRHLGEDGAVFTRAWLDLDATSARERLDPDGLLGQLAGRDVLCLAGGGGQQSAAFAVLGANVTVLDLDEGQLRRDLDAARHHGVELRIERGDMRDLTRFDSDSFDLIWHPY